MTGEILALLSALFYGAGSVAIVRGRSASNHDNGFFLSVCLTAALSGLIWVNFGEGGATQLASAQGRWGLLIFALAGLFSIVLGRVSLYRATELVGAVRASLLRRLTPVFAVPFAYVILGTFPGAGEAIGGTIILIGMLMYFGPIGHARSALPQSYVWAIGSSVFYALAYCLRSLGLESVSDPALGTFIGAVAGLGWLSARAWFRDGFQAALASRLGNNDRWHWAAALSFSFGQTLQFFALSTASVPMVAVLGTLEVVFAAALTAVLGFGSTLPKARFLLCVGFSLVGTALLVR